MFTITPISVWREEGRWSSQGLARTGYSFWLTVIATVCYFANTLIIAIATRDSSPSRKVTHLQLNVSFTHFRLRLY
jgi:hypothetical protein